MKIGKKNMPNMQFGQSSGMTATAAGLPNLLPIVACWHLSRCTNMVLAAATSLAHIVFVV